jgi:pimeloyl-ACP methyl ester carboxylesterase
MKGQTETVNGVQLYFEIHGSGEPLVLLHGFGGCSQDWAPLIPEWSSHFQLIVPDMRGHGRSSDGDRLSAPRIGDHRSVTLVGGSSSKDVCAAFRHADAATDILALLDHLGITAVKGLGVSGGGNVLLHLATRQPERVKAMVLVSATSYFPAQARPLMRQYPDTISEQDWETMRRRHPGGEPQIRALLAGTRSFADSYDDMNFTPPYLSTIQARTLIVQGDRDPFYPVEISVEMYRAIPKSSLWIVPNGGHGPIGGERWPQFVKTSLAFLTE